MSILIASFVKRYSEAAVTAMKHTGIPASVTLAQAILESNVGRSHLTVRAKNFFGIKGEGPAGHVVLPTREVNGHGHSYVIQAKFRAYSEAWQSFEDHGQFFLRNQRYRKAVTSYKQKPELFAQEIARAGYATDPHYADSLIRLMKQYELERFDTL
jgi:flagellum-specific peptidoglycan hydrolase FlgJ